jgi:NADH:ubiquinone oxidoreductase subunit
MNTGNRIQSQTTTEIEKAQIPKEAAKKSKIPPKRGGWKHFEFNAQFSQVYLDEWVREAKNKGISFGTYFLDLAIKGAMFNRTKAEREKKSVVPKPAKPFVQNDLDYDIYRCLRCCRGFN